jgi:hypothetical protein
MNLLKATIFAGVCGVSLAVIAISTIAKMPHTAAPPASTSASGSTDSNATYPDPAQWGYAPQGEPGTPGTIADPNTGN